METPRLAAADPYVFVGYWYNGVWLPAAGPTARNRRWKRMKIRTHVLGPQLFWAAGIATLLFHPAPARAEDRTNLYVVVTDSQSGEPINQAHLTLQFREPEKFGRTKPIAYSAKTNAQGKCKFPNIPKGAFRLLVTADRHQTFGKYFTLRDDNQIFEVKLKKPQPLL